MTTPGTGTGLSIVIPWRDRPELARTAPRTMAIAAEAGAEVIVVNCGGSPELLRQALDGVNHPSLFVATVDSPTFNKCLALNAGVHLARHGRIFLLDCDVLVDHPFVRTALSKLQGDCFVTVQRVHESTPAETLESHVRETDFYLEFVGPPPSRALVEVNRKWSADGSRAAPGLIMLRKAHFEAVAGMNSELRGWGWEDIDLIVRLQLHLALARECVGEAIHLTHDDSVRSTDPTGGRHATQQRNYERSLANLAEGRLQGTYAEDIRSLGPRLELLDVHRFLQR